MFQEVKEQRKHKFKIVVLTIVVLLWFWYSSDFRSSISIVLLGYILYYIYRAARYKDFRKKNALVALGLIVLAITVTPPPVTQNDRAGSRETISENLAKQEETERLAEIAQQEADRKKTETNKIKEDLAQEINPTGELHQVVGITDGDTIKVNISGKVETLRLIGMDTPETKDPRKPIQCFGREATSKMQSLVQSKQVRVVSDPSQDSRDKYGRLLAYIFLEDGRNVAYEMIKEGYAHEYTYNVPYKYQVQFKQALEFARENNKGLWAPETCNGITNQELPSAPAPQKTSEPQSSAATSPRQSNASSVYYKNCTAARSAGAAPVYAGQPGYGTHLDRDRDGVGCE